MRKYLDNIAGLHWLTVWLAFLMVSIAGFVLIAFLAETAQRKAHAIIGKWWNG